MKSKQIERVLTLAECLYISMWSFIPVLILLPLSAYDNQGSMSFVFIVPILVAFTVVGFRIRAQNQLDSHLAGLQAESATYGWQVGDPVVDADTIGTAFGRMSLSLLAKNGQRFHTYVAGQGWDYTDWSYDWYQQVRSGEFKGAEVYYSAMSAKLPRILPNVFFDSKSERGRQFKAKFTKDQRHSLEGNFDTYFDTYFAEGYTLDSLSFITPDVMEQLIRASSYDIEIVQDRVLLYGPVFVDASMLQDMAAKLLAVQKELAENADTYRDNRLSGEARATTVTPQGMFLRRKTTNWISIAIVIAAYIAFYLLRTWKP